MELGVARNTIRRALAILEEDGMLRTRSGGARIVTLPQASWRGFLGDAILVLTRLTDQPWVKHREGGWEEYVTHGVLHAVRAAGLHSVSLQWERLRETDIAGLISARPRGVVITDANRSEDAGRWMSALQAAGIPFVVYGETAVTKKFDRVYSDHELGGYLLTRWLIEQGRTRILPVWTGFALQGYWYSARRQGYERAMIEAGLEPMSTSAIPHLVRGFEDDEDWFSRFVATATHALKPSLERARVDAIAVDSDGHVPSVAAALRRLGVVPNQDVLLAGYDNYWRESPERAWEPTRPVATVDKLNLKMGAELVSLLQERLVGRVSSRPRRRVVAPEVVLVEH